MRSGGAPQYAARFGSFQSSQMLSREFARAAGGFACRLLQAAKKVVEDGCRADRPAALLIRSVLRDGALHPLDDRCALRAGRLCVVGPAADGVAAVAAGSFGVA